MIDRSYLYTAGSEGFMRVFDARTNAANDVDPLLCDYHEEPVLSLSASVGPSLLSLSFESICATC